ncbi:MAG: redoxin domain-containing protein, partial [Gammaproteobacteria bacterium]
MFFDRVFPALCAAAALSVVFPVHADKPGPGVGEKFPHTLEAPDQRGRRQTLQALMGDNGVAVFFVRSADWCPFCRGQLADVNTRVSEF